ncbi:MAG TPA: hypothetical protein VE010_11760 [Thermoanaerobaculia bacterium]|nr:hypothetical protein [Thermoanaerobaculia bacterium]
MRQIFSGAARGVLAVAVVMVLAAPAQAMPSDAPDFGWFGRTRDRIVKVIKRMTVRTFGDGLSDPKPKP